MVLSSHQALWAAAPAGEREEVDISITELGVRYFDFAKTYYVKDGKFTKD